MCFWCTLCNLIIFSIFLPELFQRYAQAIGDAVDVGIIGGYLVDIVDGPVGETVVAQGLHIGFDHFPGTQGEFVGVI